MLKVYICKLPNNLYTEDLSILIKYLPESEKTRIHKYKFIEDKFRLAIGKSLLLLLLSQAGYNANLSGLQYTMKGRPFLPFQEIDFNISHSNQFVSCGFVTNGTIGIDIERISNLDIDEMSHRFFSEYETAYIYSMNSNIEKTKAFFRIWTLKEAYLKALGSGIFGGLRDFSCSYQRGRWKITQPLSFDTRCWDFLAISLNKEYLLSVCFSILQDSTKCIRMISFLELKKMLLSIPCLH
jgi:4'-phosphopantetheinyl transferase